MIQCNNKRTGAQVSLRGFAFASAPVMRARARAHRDRVAPAPSATRDARRLDTIALYLLRRDYGTCECERAFIAENWSAPARPRQGYRRRGSQVGRQVRVN